MPIALVTGSTDGIGLETARQLLARGWDVLVHGRSQARAVQALETLGKGAQGRAQAVWGDLASMDSVRDLAGQVQTAAPALDVLLLNAGVFESRRSLSADGFERTMAVNHFAHLHLVLRLRRNLESAAAPRVVWVSSMVHCSAHLDLDDLDLARNWSGYGSYGASKLANAVCAAQMSRMAEFKRVLCFSLHPGVIGTKLLHQNFGSQGAPLKEGAETSIYCSTAAGLEALNGAYFNRSAPAKAHALVSDAAFGTGLWQTSLDRLKSWL